MGDTQLASSSSEGQRHLDFIGAKEPVRRADLALSTDRKEPRNETERKLAAIWRDVFGIDIVGVADDFFELGGDSFTATALAAEIEATFGTRFTPADIITLSTVEQQAEKLAKEKGIAIYARATAGPLPGPDPSLDGTVVRRNAPRLPGTVVGVASERDVVILDGQAPSADILAVLDDRGVPGKQLHIFDDRTTVAISRENLHDEDRLRGVSAQEVAPPGAMLPVAGMSAFAAPDVPGRVAIGSGNTASSPGADERPSRSWRWASPLGRAK